MKKFVQIYNNKAHYIFESEEKPVFHPSVILVDITGREDIQEGWDYNTETGRFSEPMPIDYIEEETQPTLEQIAEENLLETKYQTLLLEMML